MTREYSISEVSELFDIPLSTLRYYEEIGLVPSTSRRGRVRYYDRASLERLVYARLWNQDGLMSLSDTRAVIGSGNAAERHALITTHLEATRERLSRLERAAKVLEHLLQCPEDHPLDCPVTGAHLRARVEAVLSGASFTQDVLDTSPN